MRNVWSITDYIITKQDTFINNKDTRVKRGAKCGADHRLIISEMGFPHTTNTQPTKREPWSLIPKPKTRKAFPSQIYNMPISEKTTQEIQEFKFSNVEGTYEHVQLCIMGATLKALGKIKKPHPKKPTTGET